MAELVLSLRDRELSRTPITHAKLIVGRDAGCDVVIDNAGVSRNHAIVLYMDDEFRVRDMDSQNGVTVNGKRVKTKRRGARSGACRFAFPSAR
jgi:pSer/pThr/pTyr-binding forkhead associated (FHA) protein